MLPPLIFPPALWRCSPLTDSYRCSAPLEICLSRRKRSFPEVVLSCFVTAEMQCASYYCSVLSVAASAFSRRVVSRHLSSRGQFTHLCCHPDRWQQVYMSSFSFIALPSTPTMWSWSVVLCESTPGLLYSSDANELCTHPSSGVDHHAFSTERRENSAACVFFPAGEVSWSTTTKICCS